MRNTIEIADYKLTITGEVENIAGFLSDLLENQTTPLNSEYNIQFGNIEWTTDLNNRSVAVADFTADKTLLKSDLDVIRQQYSVTVVSRRKSY